MQADHLVAHLAFDFGARGEGGDRVDDDDVDRAGTHQHVGDFQRLFAGIGLRDQQLADIDAEFLRILRIERVFGIDEGGVPPSFLHFGDDLQTERGLAGGFRAVDFDDAAARQAADAKRDIQPERAGGNDLNALVDLGIAHLHDGAFAELLFDLLQRCGERFCLVVVHAGTSKFERIMAQGPEME
jgi:hypothetical protein